MPIRSRVLRSVARADLALFRRVARGSNRHLEATLPRLTRTADNSKLWMVIAALMVAGRRRKLRRGALRGLLSVGVTSALVNGPLKWIGRRERPALDIVPETRRILKLPVTSSFPSGHTASAFAFATGATLESKRLGLVLYPLATAVGASRVYTGAHYPSDVAAGAVIGVTTAALSTQLWPAPPERPARAETVQMPADALPTPTGEGVSIVVNTSSGANDPTLMRRIASALPDAQLIEVDPEGDSLTDALSAAAADSKVLGVCGGDGTVNAAARVTLEHDIPLLVIPGGTLDHFAEALGLDGPRAAATALEEPRVAAVDVGWIDGQPFLNTASLGGYVDMVRYREKIEDTLGKWPALFIALGRVLRRGEAIDLTIDGEPTKVWLAFFGNCRYEPRGFGPTWRDRLDDGQIDLRYVEADQPWARTRLFAAIATGRLGRCRVYKERTVTSLTISADRDLKLSRDGEVFDGSRSFELKKTERSLKVLLPAKETK